MKLLKPKILQLLQLKVSGDTGEHFILNSCKKLISGSTEHVEMVLKSLEKIYEPGQTPENVWEPVFQATQDKSEAVKTAEAKAHEARMAVGQLKETVAYCLKNDQSKQSPDLITMDENVARALYR